MTVASIRPAEEHPAAEYLRATFREDDHIFFFLVHSFQKHKDSKGDDAADVHLGPLYTLKRATSPKILAELEKFEGDGWNVYVSMNPFPEGTKKRTESLIKTIRNVYIETDGGSVLPMISVAVDEGEIPAPHSILESSPGKYHIVWHVRDISPEEAKALNRSLASRYGGDIACVDLHRVLRMPGFRNLKYPEKPLCELVDEIRADGPYSREQFKIQTVVLKANGVPIKDEALAAAIFRLEENAKEARFDLGPRVKDSNGFRWDITCPWASEHTTGGKSAIVMLLMDGKLEFSCLHQHCAHRGWSDIRKLWEETAGHRLEFASAKEETERFAVEGGELCAVHWERKRGENEALIRTVEPLANFDAQIERVFILDDGVTKTKAHILRGTHKKGRPLEKIRVNSEDFSSMNWVGKEWSAFGASMRPGLGVRDKLRAGIEFLSPEPPIEHIFTHTGWTELEKDRWGFLHAGGAIGGDAIVDLGAQSLARYTLPDCADAKISAVDAMRLSFALLDIGPGSITIPLWAAMFRAPLASFLPLNFSIWLDATTGNLKTTLVSLFLCHFGDFDVNHTPANWSSTANSLEHQAFMLQDLPLLIDEYVPTRIRDPRELEAKAARLIGAQGNLTGRGRMDQNLKERQSFFPRGEIISTGEGRPPGESIAARCIVLEPRREQIDLVKLSAAQETAKNLSYAMTGYLTWLAPQAKDLKHKLAEMQKKASKKMFLGTAHLRIPETVGSVLVGAEMAVQYAVESKTLTEKEAKELRDRIDEALRGTVIEHADRVRDENPARRFLRVLLAMLDSGQALMWHKDSDMYPPKDIIGWYDNKFLYFLPEVAHKTVAEFCQRQGESFNMRERVVRKQFHQLGVLERQGSVDYTSNVLLVGKQRRLVVLRRKETEVLMEGAGFPNDGPTMMKKGGK